MTTLLLLAHPDLETSRVNRALLKGLQGLSDLEIADLYAFYPDNQIDPQAEIDRLLRADRVVLQFPLFWYSTPPLLKLWEDVVLTPMFYQKPDLGLSTAGLPVLAATTTGGPSASYHPESRIGLTIDDLFASLKATTRRCGWHWQSPFAVHDVRNLDDGSLAKAVDGYRSTIVSFMTLSRISAAA